jgi:MerR family copper efflux transcriptional regulator
MTTALKIKDVAEASGFTAATLRYYEQIGLLPEALRTPAGYRVYDQRTLDRLAFIARAKQLGCTLDEITGLTTAWDGGQCGPIQDRLRGLVAGKIDAAQHQLAELATFTAELRQAAAALEGHRPEGACDADCGCVSAPAEAISEATAIGGAVVARGVSLSSKPVRDLDPGAAQADPAIACTLSAGSMHDRLVEWNEVLTHVTSRERIDEGVRCEFAGRVPAGELMRLVAAEQECCQFFRFAITVDQRGIALEVRAATDAQAIVASIFGVAA